MFVLFLLIFTILLISIILIFLNFIISKKMWLDREKTSPFECGFDSMSASRLPFSIHFFVISILFLVFDVEVVFLIPIIKAFSMIHYVEWFIISYLILLILFLGLEFEKIEGSLNWII